MTRRATPASRGPCPAAPKQCATGPCHSSRTVLGRAAAAFRVAGAARKRLDELDAVRKEATPHTLKGMVPKAGSWMWAPRKENRALAPAAEGEGRRHFVEAETFVRNYFPAGQAWRRR